MSTELFAHVYASGSNFISIHSFVWIYNFFFCYIILCTVLYTRVRFSFVSNTIFSSIYSHILWCLHTQFICGVLLYAVYGLQCMVHSWKKKKYVVYVCVCVRLWVCVCVGSALNLQRL